jgi:hypothetical protein
MAFLLLAACSTNGDFKEIRPTLVSDDIHDWVGLKAIEGYPTFPSAFPLTDDERYLRDYAYPLIEPPYERHRWYSIAGEYGAFAFNGPVPFDRTAYATWLMSVPDRSASTRYNQLSDDIRNDMTRIPQFFETAGRVIDIDQKRRKSLGYVSVVSDGEIANAVARNKENALIVSMVRTSLAQRVSAYQFALERLVILTPSPQAIEVERLLNQLRAQVAFYHAHLSPTWYRGGSLNWSPNY